jgi:hypothetical protein
MSRCRKITVLAVGAAAVLAAAAAPASAAKVVNGGFERGNLSGWNTFYYPSEGEPIGEWSLYSVVPRGVPIFPLPPQGQTAAFTDQGEVSGQILSQVVKLRKDRRHRLSFQLGWINDTEDFATPPTLALVDPNQQFRMDVMKPGAPIKSVKNKDVLERVHRTDVGDPNQRGFRSVTANLTRYAGEKVRLRFAVAVTENRLHALLDAVKIRTKRS